MKGPRKKPSHWAYRWFPAETNHAAGERVEFAPAPGRDRWSPGPDYAYTATREMPATSATNISRSVCRKRKVVHQALIRTCMGSLSLFANIHIAVSALSVLAVPSVFAKIFTLCSGIRQNSDRFRRNSGEFATAPLRRRVRGRSITLPGAMPNFRAAPVRSGRPRRSRHGRTLR